jgi:hypothetical protein
MVGTVPELPGRRNLELVAELSGHSSKARTNMTVQVFEFPFPPTFRTLVSIMSYISACEHSIRYIGIMGSTVLILGVSPIVLPTVANAVVMHGAGGVYVPGGVRVGGVRAPSDGIRIGGLRARGSGVSAGGAPQPQSPGPACTPMLAAAGECSPIGTINR